MRHRLQHLGPDEFVDQQPQRPALPPVRRDTAGEGDEMRLCRAVQRARIHPIRHLALQRNVQAVLDIGAPDPT